MFMFGDQNASLSYLADLKGHGVELAKIPQCGHFSMYSNPPVIVGAYLAVHRTRGGLRPDLQSAEVQCRIPHAWCRSPGGP
jgi:hypothetical protein